MMNKTEVYNMSLIETYKEENEQITFIFSLCDEKRSQTVLSHLTDHKFDLKNIIVIKYYEQELPDSLKDLKKNVNITEIRIKNSPMDFINSLKYVNNDFWECKLLIDISCIRVPEMFTLLKHIKLKEISTELNVFYSIPYDYVFENEPFTSYKSYYGDLTMYELPGFSGVNLKDQKEDLFLFMGFESALGLKVIENSTYGKLNLINNLPSFFPKYKDISVINNYQLMKNTHTYLYTPADNPFETYNLLDKEVSEKSMICIAPLSTKPVALGVCLYAINNQNARVVYPISEQYNKKNTLETYKTYLYKVLLNSN